MIDARFRSELAAAIQSGLSVTAIERKFGISNRNVRRIKAAMYEAGALPKTRGGDVKPKDDYAIETN